MREQKRKAAKAAFLRVWLSKKTQSTPVSPRVRLCAILEQRQRNTRWELQNAVWAICGGLLEYAEMQR